MTAPPPWTCPFCPLLCDDRDATAPGCPKAEAGLAALARPDGAGAASARLHGQPVPREQALRVAAEWLHRARQPLLSGWGADVAAARALYPLACRVGAVSDVAGGEALAQALRAQQDRGGYTATLAEVRSRADLIVCVGSWPAERAPRLFERLLAGREVPPAIVVLGDGIDPPRSIAVEGRSTDVEWLAPGLDLPATAAALHLALTRPERCAQENLQRLAERLRAARYVVLIWEPSQLGAHAALVIERLQGLIGRLNLTGRAAGFPLGGAGGAATAQAVHAWLSGLPLRTQVGPRGLEHDALRLGSERLLADRAVDLLLWVGSFPDQQPPPCDSPRILLGPPSLAAALGHESATIFLPVGTPGVDHAGHLVRCDSVVMLPMQSLRPPTWPSVAETVNALRFELQQLDSMEVAA
jgi:formylmethanofuran dehydrogenase subunit B